MASPNTLALRNRVPEPATDADGKPVAPKAVWPSSAGTLRVRPPGPKVTRRQKRAARKVPS